MQGWTERKRDGRMKRREGRLKVATGGREAEKKGFKER